MKEELITDIWIIVVEHIPEKYRKDTAADFVNALVDHGIKDSVLDGLRGVDPYLDEAIEYSIDGEEVEDEPDYGYEEEDE
jgi:predicted DNA-binding protein (UPF0278 family)